MAYKEVMSFSLSVHDHVLVPKSSIRIFQTHHGVYHKKMLSSSSFQPCWSVI